jgi:Short C-terminal domain
MHPTHRWIMPILLSATLLAGCSHREVLQPAVEVTFGQQLIDLKRAHDSGALSASEYQRQKQRLIDSIR